MNARAALEGVGAALLLPYVWPFLSPSNLPLYHHGLPVTSLVGGLLIDLLGVAILAFSFLVTIQYLPTATQRVLLALFAGFILWRIVDFAIPVLSNLEHPILWWDGARKQSCVFILLLSGILAYFLPHITQLAVHAVRVVVAAFAFSALWIVPQLFHLALVRAPDEIATSKHLPAPTLNSSKRRILWILFDELSYDQTFDHPASGIKLPNFDRLRTESVSFSNLKPAGFHTDRIIPSLFLGRRIDQIRSTVHGDLWYKAESHSRWLAFDPNITLFALAQRNGWSSGVDGWFNPYCHILAPVLSVCFWEPAILSTEGYGASEEKSILANAASVPKALLVKLFNRTATAPANAGLHIQQYRNLMMRAHALIENESIDFVFLHLPVPHPPGIYDRQRHVLRTSGTYLDNLVLADDTLGTVLQEIDATSTANRTTAIVSSDHSWRIRCGEMLKPGARRRAGLGRPFRRQASSSDSFSGARCRYRNESCSA